VEYAQGARANINASSSRRESDDDAHSVSYTDQVPRAAHTCSWHKALNQAAWHRQPKPTLVELLADPGFWFVSFQNWRSEILAVLALVTVSTFFASAGFALIQSGRRAARTDRRLVCHGPFVTRTATWHDQRAGALFTVRAYRRAAEAEAGQAERPGRPLPFS
jgi:hypothetical protein